MIIIDIDTLRADHLGCYGYQRNTSPNIDAFATRGTRFAWTFSQAPNTPPSQASILTGLYPSTHGMIYDENRIPSAAVTLPEVLAEHGYSTVGIHDGGYLKADFGFDQGFEIYDDQRGQGFKSGIPRALEWLGNRDPEKPFLLFLHTYDTHTPYAPSADFRELFLDGLEPPTPGFEPTSEIMEKVRTSVWTETKITLPDNDIEYAKALYDAEIREVDDWVGRFLDQLEVLGLADDVAIVVLSDHGEEFNEHGSVLHEKLYAPVTHVPFILVAPGVRAGDVVDVPVETVDLMPTLLELAGVPIPDRVQGESLVPVLRGQNPTSDVAFGESPFFGERRFVAVGEHRLLLTRKSGDVELFRYRTDPLELEDLAVVEKGPVEDLVARIDLWEARVKEEHLEQDGEPEEMSEGTVDQLKALGYIADEDGH